MRNMIFAAALLCSFPAGARPAEAGRASVCVYQYKGEVLVAGPAGDGWTAVNGPVLLAEGSRLRTGKNAWCQILAGDGSFMNIYENSETTLDKLRFGGEGRDYGFSFVKGRVLWMAAKLKSGLSRFEVRTPAAVCAVRGTDFAIDISSSSSEIGLFEGQLAIRSGDKESTLTAGGGAVVDAPGSEARLNARLSRLMEAEKRRYLRLKKRVEELRAKMAAREGFIDEFVRARQEKLRGLEDRRREKLEKRK